MKKRLICLTLLIALALPVVALATEYTNFDAIAITGLALGSVGSETALIDSSGNLSFSGATAVFTYTTSFITYTPNFTVGYDSGAYMKIAVSDTTGNTAITFGGSTKNLSLTTTGAGTLSAASWAITGNITLTGTFTDGTATLNSGAWTGLSSVTSTTITDGTATLTGGALSGVTNLTCQNIIDSSGGGTGTQTITSVVEYAGAVQKSVITLTLTGDNDIDVADGDKSTGQLIYTFPAGYIKVIGAVIDAQDVTNAVYNADTNDQYYLSVGSVDGTQAADADLTSTEADIIGKTTIDTDSGAGANTQLTNTWTGQLTTDASFDGTSAAAKLYVNVAVPGASDTDATTHAITGTLTVYWINLGDY